MSKKVFATIMATCMMIMVTACGNQETSKNIFNSGERATEEKTQNKVATGMRPEFKEAMDSYEELMNEYCRFMKKYKESNDPTSMVAEYVSYMEKYSEAMAKLEKVDESTLSGEELVYYTEVTTRVTKKLLEVE